MEMTEERMLFLEEQIPELAVAALKQAFLQALASGSSVLTREGDHLVELFPDCTRKVIKPLPPMTLVTPGQIISLK